MSKQRQMCNQNYVFHKQWKSESNYDYYTFNQYSPPLHIPRFISVQFNVKSRGLKNNMIIIATIIVYPQQQRQCDRLMYKHLNDSIRVFWRDYLVFSLPLLECRPNRLRSHRSPVQLSTRYRRSWTLRMTHVCLQPAPLGTCSAVMVH